MARKNLRTGSTLLGAELKRLRATRTLDEIVELARTEPLCHYIESIGAPTLSQLETGTTLPKMPTLHAVSVMYKTSLTHLMCLVTEDRLAGRGVLPAFPDTRAAKGEFDRLYCIGEWYRALPIAIHQERIATDELSRLDWRCNRALCLSQMGMHQEAISILLEAAEERVPAARLRYRIVNCLFLTHRSAGYLNAAASFAQQAAALVDSAELTDHDTALLNWQLACLIIASSLYRLGKGERELREAIRHLDIAREKWSATDETRDARLGLARGEAYLALGNLLVARSETQKAKDAGARVGSSLFEAHACFSLATIRQRQGAPVESRELTERALGLAEEGRHYLLLFEVSLELFKQMRERQPTIAVEHLRRCRTLHPILTSRSPMVHEFEQLTRDLA